MREPALRLLDDPFVCPSSYAFDAYCRYDNPEHGFNEFPHTPANVQTRGEALADLRGRGWLIHRDGTATCPKCARLLKSRTAAARSLPNTKSPTHPTEVTNDG